MAGYDIARIHAFVPTEAILEIAPGFGRCTQYLKDLCQQLMVVDLTEKCLKLVDNGFRHVLILPIMSMMENR